MIDPRRIQAHSKRERQFRVTIPTDIAEAIQSHLGYGIQKKLFALWFKELARILNEPESRRHLIQRLIREELSIEDIRALIDQGGNLANELRGSLTSRIEEEDLRDDSRGADGPSSANPGE